VPIVSGCQTRCSPATPSNLFQPSRPPIEAGAPEHTYLAGDSPARSEHAPDAGSPRRKGSAFNNLRRPNFAASSASSLPSICGAGEGI